MLQELLCLSCGLLTYSPRPSPESEGEVRGTPSPRHQPGAAGRDRAPMIGPAMLAESLSPHLPDTGARVLDIGGGDGRLLVGLVERGVDCAVVDYNPASVPGVTRLGETIDDVPSTERFDAVVLSHVLEHVASPREIVEALGPLRPVGRGYARGPVEIGRGTPVAVDPVTHVQPTSPAPRCEHCQAQRSPDPSSDAQRGLQRLCLRGRKRDHNTRQGHIRRGSGSSGPSPALAFADRPAPPSTRPATPRRSPARHGRRRSGVSSTHNGHPTVSPSIQTTARCSGAQCKHTSPSCCRWSTTTSTDAASVTTKAAPFATSSEARSTHRSTNTASARVP